MAITDDTKMLAVESEIRAARGKNQRLSQRLDEIERAANVSPDMSGVNTKLISIDNRLMDLGTAADSDAADFATAGQGSLAETALQPEDAAAFATAAQGRKADTALQSTDLGEMVQRYAPRLEDFAAADDGVTGQVWARGSDGKPLLVDAATGDMRGEDNLASLSDKRASRDNLDVMSRGEVLAITPKATVAHAMIDAPAADPEFYDIAYCDSAYKTGSGSKWRRSMTGVLSLIAMGVQEWSNHLYRSCAFVGNYTKFPLQAHVSFGDGNAKFGTVTGLPTNIRNALVTPFS